MTKREREEIASRIRAVRYSDELIYAGRTSAIQQQYYQSINLGLNKAIRIIEAYYKETHQKEPDEPNEPEESESLQDTNDPINNEPITPNQEQED